MQYILLFIPIGFQQFFEKRCIVEEPEVKEYVSVYAFEG